MRVKFDSGPLEAINLVGEMRYIHIMWMACPEVDSL